MGVDVNAPRPDALQEGPVVPNNNNNTNNAAAAATNTNQQPARAEHKRKASSGVQNVLNMAAPRQLRPKPAVARDPFADSLFGQDDNVCDFFVCVCVRVCLCDLCVCVCVCM